MTNLEQDAISYQTYQHINEVMKQLAFVQQELMKRQFTHDRSKLDSPEVEMFTEMTSKLKGLTYGSEEYKQSLKDLGPALGHHYSKNRHHAEHFENGINDMNLIDLIEMVCDWRSSVKRHADGCIYKSLEINKERFNISDQLYSVIRNTVDYLESRENIFESLVYQDTL
jgi:hypothetical protein